MNWGWAFLGSIVVFALLILGFVDSKKYLRRDLDVERNLRVLCLGELEKANVELMLHKDFLRIFVNQELVDGILRKLAHKFHEVAQQEIARQGELSFDKYAADFDKLKGSVEAAKIKFWRAHELARKLGYEVRPKYTDYLPELAAVSR